MPSQVLKRGAKATTGDSDTARLKEAEVELSSLLIEARVGATTGSESLPVDRPVSSSTNQLVSNHQTTDLGVAEHEYNSQKKSLRMGKCRTKPGEMAVGGNNRHEFSRKSNRAWENARSTDGTSQYVSTKENVSIIAEKPCGRKAAVDWRAVPFADLRKHPLYLPLPDELDAPRLRRDTPESPSASVHVSIPSVAAELCLLRQDSWQWHALHRGRLTTSALAACLGFYEAHTAQYLDIPSSLR